MDWSVEESLEGGFALPPVMPSPLPEMSTHQKSITPPSRLPADSTVHSLLTSETSTPDPVGQDHQQEDRAAVKNVVCPTPVINPEQTPDVLPSLSHPSHRVSTTSAAPTPAATATDVQVKKKRRPNKSAAAQARNQNFYQRKKEERAQQDADIKAARSAGAQGIGKDHRPLSLRFCHKLFSSMSTVETNITSQDLSHQSTAFCGVKHESEGIPGPHGGKVLFGTLHENVHKEVLRLIKEENYTYVCAPDNG